MASGLLTVGTTALPGAMLDLRDKNSQALCERLQTAMLMAIPEFVGAVAGAMLAPQIPETALLVGFLTLMLATATRRLQRPTRQPAEDGQVTATVPRSMAVIVLVGLGLGILTGIFGISGEFLVVPALVGLFRLTAVPAADEIVMDENAI